MSAPSPSPAPWLSILLPLFRVRPWLAECLDSILAQTDLDGVEILMLDDASDDGSRELARDYAERHPQRLRLLCNERNAGIAEARNRLLDEAHGTYLWFVDPDDVMMPDAVPSLRRCIEAWQPDLVMCDFRLVRERFLPKHARRGELHKRSFIGPSHQLLTDRSRLVQGLFDAGHLQPWCKILRRAIWPAELRFPPGRCFEDVYMMPRVILHARNYVHIPEVWIGYRKREGSILAGMTMKKIDDRSLALIGYGEELHEMSSSARFSQAFFAAGTFIGACRHASRAGEPLRPYREHLWQTIDFDLLGLSLQYLKRGWGWRWLRLLTWLLRAKMDTR